MKLSRAFQRGLFLVISSLTQSQNWLAICFIRIRRLEALIVSLKKKSFQPYFPFLGQFLFHPYDSPWQNLSKWILLTYISFVDASREAMRPVHMLFPFPGALLLTPTPSICLTYSLTSFGSLRCHFIHLYTISLHHFPDPLSFVTVHHNSQL